MDLLRRFQSEPVLANPRLESRNYKIKSDLRQSILHRHRHVTPISDKRHPTRSTMSPKKQPTQQQQQTSKSTDRNKSATSDFSFNETTLFNHSRDQCTFFSYLFSFISFLRLL